MPVSSKKQLFTSDPASEINIASSAVESSDEIFPSTSGANETNEPDISVESNVEMDQQKKVEDLEARLLEVHKEFSSLRKKNDELDRKITENQQHQETMSSRLFSLDRFKSDADVNFYTGLPNYATVISILVRIAKTFALGLAQMSQRSFTTLNLTTRKMGRQPRKDVAERLI